MTTKVSSNIDQKWTTGRKSAQYVLLVGGFLATFVGATVLMKMAGDVVGTDAALAAQYAAWSTSIIVLGPSLFVTSFLAMGSHLVRRQRWVVRGAAFVLAAALLLWLGNIGPDFLISVILGFIGILYCFAVDAATPNSAV